MARHERPEPSAPHRVLRLLVAGPESRVPRLRRLLETHGHEVVGEARDGLEASRLSGALEPEIAILDLSTPILDGIATGSLIRKLSPSTRLIVLSDHADPAFAEAAIQAGFSGYVVEGRTSARLLEAVRTVADGELYVTSISPRTRS